MLGARYLWILGRSDRDHYHVNDLGESDLQCDINDMVCVLDRPQGIGVVGEQVSHQLLSVAAMSSQGD